jgi:hypothetical protein
MLARSREDRKNVRRFTRRAATLSFGNQKPSFGCVIWDVSEDGARLAVALPLADLPHRTCEVVWMDKRFVGVKFTDHIL